MAVDVIIDPLTGQIYWNDSQGTAQSIAISGNGTDLIKTVGYSLQFSAAPAGTITTGSATTAVSGSGTNFLTLFGSGAAGSGAVLYTSQGTSIGTISTVSSDTALSLQANASGSYTGITFRYSPPAGTDRLILSDSSTPIYPATTGANLGTSSYRWSLYASLGDITNSGTTAINLMLDKSGIGSTESPALQFINTTAATSGAQYQFAPWNEFRGKAWNTGSLASNDVRMRMGMAALSGNTPTSEFVIASSVDTGTASWYYPLTLNATANDSVLYLNNGVISIGKLLTNGTTSSYALELYNYNLATSGQTANWSPAFEMNGSAWNTSTATSNILRFRSEVQTTSGNPISGSIFWKSAITTSYSATPSFSNNLSLSNTNGLGLWNANTAASYLKASGSQASDIVYTFPASAPTTNQVLSASSVSGSSITLTWSTSASGSGTVNSGASGKVAYYPSLGTAVDDATALDYSTTSPHLTVTAQATTAIPLKLVGIASQSVDLFQVATSGANVFTVGSAGISTFANSTAASGTTSGALIITGGIGVGSTSYLSTTNITTLTLTNALAVGQGGTGTSTAPNQWGVIFATSTSQYNSTAAGSADQVLKSGGGTGAPSFGAINLASSNAVSNTLALSNGGLGTTTFTQNGVLYGNAATSILVTSASGAAGAILQTTTSGGVPSFSTTLPGTYSFSSSTAASSTTVAAVVFSGGIGVGSTSYLSDLYTVGTILSATSATTVSISTSAATKTINIGIGGTSSHTTTITIGTTAGTSTLTIESPTVATNTTSLTLFNANATTVNAFGAATTLTLGATTGTGTIRNVTIDFPNATTISGSTGLATVFSAANPASLAVFGAATTATIFGSATSLTLGAATGTASIRNTTVTLTNATVVNINGNDPVIQASTTGTVTLFNTSNATVNAFGAATALTLGATTGTATIRNTTATFSNATVFNINGNDPVIQASTTGTVTLFNTSNATVNAFGAATALTLGATTGTATIRNTTATFSNATVVNINGNDPTIQASTTGTVTLFNTSNATVNAFGAATAMTLGAATGTASIRNTTVTLTNATVFNINGNAPVIQASTTGTVTLFNTSNTTVNAFGAATALNMGSSAGTATLANATVTFSNATTVNVNGNAPVIQASTTGTVTLFNTSNTTVNAFGAATALNMGSSAGTATIANATVTFSNAATVNINGNAPVIQASTTGTVTLFNTSNTTVNAFGAATALNMGSSAGTATIANATVTFSNAATVNINGNAPVIQASTTGTVTLFNTSNTTVNAFGAATALTLGATTGTTTIRNTTVALTNATSITGTSAAITMFGESTTFTLMGTTAASTTNIATGNNGANAKILNLATGGAGAGASNVNVGVATGTFTVNSATSNIGTTAVSGVVAILSSSFTANNATTFSATSATSLSLGASTGTATIGNTTFTLSNATSITGTSAAITMFGESTSFTLMGTTATSTINIATGNNGTNAKTLNLATGGAGAGASNVNVGVATGTFTVNSATSNIGTTAVSGTVAVLSSTFTANNATTFSATSATTLSLGASTGTATIGNTTFTLTNATSITGTSAAITMFGESTTFTLMATTATSTTNIATGNNGTNAKTLNLATGGAGAGASNVNVGVSTGTFTVNSATSNIGTTAVSGTVAVLSSSFTANNATTFSATSATTLSLGASTGTATIGNTTFTLTNATSITGTSAAITMFGESTSFTLLGTTATSTINIATGNNGTNAKTLNLATGGAGAGNSNINIGVSTGTTSVKSSTFDLANATSITGSASLATVFATANPASLALFGAATTLVIGSTAGTITIANSTATFSGATANFSANTAFNLGTSVTGASSINIGTGAVAGAIKAINIGTGGSGTGTSTIIIGTTSGTSTITLNGVTTLSSALAVGSGGTGTSTAPTQWGVIFATSSSAYNSTAAGSTNQWIRAVTSGAPTWSTATLATTYASGDLLYASSSNTVGGLTSTATSVLITQGAAAPSWLQGATGNRLLKTSGSAISWGQVDLASGDVTGTLPVGNGGTGQTTYTDGQLLIGNTTGNTLTKATLTPGTNISITNGNGSITINATSSGSGTVNSGAAGKIAYYPTATTTVDDAAALDYSTTTTHLTITAQGASTSPLELVGAASQTANFLNVKNSAGTSLISFATTSSGSGAKLLIQGTSSNQDDLLRIENSGTYTITGGYAGQRGLRVVYRTNGNNTADRYFWSISRGYDGFGFFNFGCDETTGVGLTIGSASEGFPLSAKVIEDATTDTVKDVINIERTTSGTAAAGIGGRISFRQEHAGGTLVNTIGIDGLLSNAGSTTYVGALSIKTNSAGTTTLSERVRIDNTSVQLSPIGTSAGNTNELRFLELAATGSNYIAFKAPDSIATNYTYVLPDAAPSAGQLLSASAPSGGVVTLSWATDQLGTSGGGITSLNALTAASQSFANDTNVTITSATATHTLGWQGTLAVGRGGTGTSTTPTQWGVAYGLSASALAYTGAGASGQLLLAVTSNAPQWGTMSGDASIGNTGVVTIANSAVTFAKMQNSAAAGLSVIGRSTNSAGAFAEIATTTDGAVLRLSGTTLGFGSINLATTNAVTGILPVGNGGTGTSTAPTQWGITFATSASQYASTAAGSTNQWIRAVTSGAPTWSTATLATTYAAGDLLYASAGNTVGGLTSTATSVLITQGAAGPSWLQGATGNRLLKTSGSAISWGQVDLASGDVTGTLAVGSGGTGTSSFAINTILTSGASTTGAVTTATALAYSASSQHLTITAQGAATSPLRLVGTTSQTADLFQVFSTSAGTLLGSVGAFGGATFTSLATSATTPATALVVTGAAHTALNTATEYSDAYFNFGQTKTFTSGAITTLRTFRVAPATYAFSGASTVTNAATLQIDGAPTAGTNATLTEAAALRILTGTASGKGLVIRGSTSQTGNFIDVQNNSGTSLVTLGTTNINLAPHGASAGNTFELRFSELAATGSNYIAFKAPDDIATTYTYVLPSAAPSAGQLLSASAPSAGVVTLSWATDQLGTSGGGITSLGGLTAASQSFANDTNVTITSATATHTLGWQGELAISRGGTGTSTAPTQWGVMFATSTTAIRSTAAAGSTNQWLASVSAGAPVWSTATLATTYAAGDLLYASAGNVVGGLTSTATSVLITQGAAAPSWLQGATGNRLLKTSGSAISWGQVDLASGDVTGTLAIGGGGTGTSTAPTQWGVMFATSASAIRSTAAPASTNQLLAGVSGGAPVWSTATFATTYLIGQFLYASGANAVSGLATTTFSVDTTNVRIGIGTSAASTPLHVLNAGTGTNAVVVMDTIDVQSTATPAAGFGGSILFDLESSTTTGQDAASIETVWATATHATRLAELNFKTNDVNTSTLTERMSISNITTGQSSTNATVIITGTLGVNSTSYLSSLSLNTALAIGSGGTNTSSFATTNGLVYFNGTNLLTTNAAASGIVVTSGGNVPSVATDIPTAVTIGSGYIYRGGGTDVPLADGGTNASLTANQGGVIYSTASAMAINTPGSSGQPLLSGGTGAPTFGTLGMGAGGTGLTTTAPGANYILGMNSGNSGLEYKQLVQGSNITITHAANQVTITASGGSATAGGSDTQIQYNNATALAGISNFTFASNLVSLTNATNFANTSTPGMQLKYNTAAGTTTVNNNSPALDFIGRIYASAADRHARIRQEIQTTAATPSHALVWSSSYDTGTASYTRVLSVHSVDGLGFWNYAGTPGSAANYFKTGNQASDIRYTWPTTAPTTNQVLSATTVSGSDITLGWATAGGGAGTVGSGTINQLAYYSGATTTASDASLVRAATGTHLTITAQGASTSPLKVVGAASQSAALFTVATSGADVLVVGSGGAITTGTWNGTAIGVLYGGTGQTTYTDGQLLIGNSTGNTLTKATLTAGSGVAVTNGSGSITVRQKRPLTLTFCSGFTPAATGADSVVLRIPDSPADGSTSLTYNLRELFLRVETPSAGTSTVQVEYYTGTAAFSATNLLSTALSATGAAAYEFASTGFSTSTLASGTKLRLNFTAINATHANFFIQLLLEEN